MANAMHDNKTDDAALFRAEMAADGVMPLKTPAQSAPNRVLPPPLPLQHLADEAAVQRDAMRDTGSWDADIETGDLIAYLRPGLPGEIMRKLKRGHWSEQDAIDLHGAVAAEVRGLLAQFIGQARQRGLRCVRIVHGKGLRSPGGVAVLRGKVRLSLTQRDEVLAFCDAAPADGGEGAVRVLLKGG